MTFDIKIQICEHCKQKYLVEDMNSWNTFHSTVWSGGRTTNPSYIEPINVFKCEECSKINWVKSNPNKIDTNKIDFKTMKFIPSLSKELCEEIILNKLYVNLKDEIYIRIKYWHLCNDENRSSYMFKSESKNSKFELNKSNKILIENLNWLLSILEEDKSNLDHQILRCEILREMGLFEDARQLLSEIKINEDDEIIDIFNNLINKNDDTIQTIY